jgi:hypothetical protein
MPCCSRWAEDRVADHLHVVGVVGEQAPEAVVLEAAVLNANVVAVVEAQAGALRARERQIADQQVLGALHLERIARVLDVAGERAEKAASARVTGTREGDGRQCGTAQSRERERCVDARPQAQGVTGQETAQQVAIEPARRADAAVAAGAAAGVTGRCCVVGIRGAGRPGGDAGNAQEHRDQCCARAPRGEGHR